MEDDESTLGEVEPPDIPPPRPLPRRRKRRWRVLRWVLGLLLLLAAFWIGIAVGKALQEAPRPGGAQTGVRTLVPQTIGGARTVTVTVAGP